MRPLWMLKDDATDYVLKHSRLARWAPESAKQMAREAAAILRMAKGEQLTRQELHQLLTAELQRLLTFELSLLWPVLRLLVPIVVRLVLNWWFTELEIERRNENFD